MINRDSIAAAIAEIRQFSEQTALEHHHDRVQRGWSRAFALWDFREADSVTFQTNVLVDYLDRNCGARNDWMGSVAIDSFCMGYLGEPTVRESGLIVSGIGLWTRPASVLALEVEGAITTEDTKAS